VSLNPPLSKLAFRIDKIFGGLGTFPFYNAGMILKRPSDATEHFKQVTF